MPKFRIGTDDFKRLRQNNGYFVDKSLFIKEIIDGADVTLIPRPRRFGKTLNMTMLRYFFEKSDEDHSNLFNDLSISAFPDYMVHQGQYPVIYLSLKNIKGTSWDGAKDQIIQIIGRCCSQADLPLSQLKTEDREMLQSLVTYQPSDTILSLSIKLLTLWLYEYHQKPVIVLIDEYDTPMIEAWSNGYYNEMAGFMRSWLGSGLKQDQGQVLYRAVVTGILRVAKESIFSELNNMKVASSLLPQPLSHLFGFTQEEIDKILIDFDLPACGPTLHEWYNGYSFGQKMVYNPWSVTNFIDNYPAPPAPHWLNTSSNALVYEELEAGGLEMKRDIEILLSGGELRYPISETITFSEIGKSPMNLWSFLYYSGYLKAENPLTDIRGRITYKLSIPNREIYFAYEHFVESLYYKTGGGIEALLRCFLDISSLSQLESILQDLTLGLVSMYDLAKLPEAVFHAFFLGLLANLRNVYEIRSNVEAGYGRADILMIPKTREYQTGYIIEFKTSDSEKNNKKIKEDALNQIRVKEYQTALINAGVRNDQIVKIAVILQGKKILISFDSDQE